MKTFITSDVHVDFVCLQTMDYEKNVPFFEKMYAEHFKEADVCLLAGDIANDFLTQTQFYRFIGTKYKEVYVVFGNHDLVVRGSTFGNGNPYSTSDEKISAVKEFLKDYPNVHILDGDVLNGIGGTMGMCDFQCYKLRSTKAEMEVWKYMWFDGRHWRYMLNDPKDILTAEHGKLDNIVVSKPKVIMTHFCPFEMGINPKFASSDCSSFFYFVAKKWLDQMDDGSYWVCGHTHDAWKVEYVNAIGNKVTILCNPIGYTDASNNEEPLKLNNLTLDDFIVDL